METLLLHLQGGVGHRALAVRLCLPVAAPATKSHDDDTTSQSHAKAAMQKQQRDKSPGARSVLSARSAQCSVRAARSTIDNRGTHRAHI